VHQLVIIFKKVCGSVRRDVIYSVFTDFGIPRKLYRLIKMCFNETYSIVHIGKNPTSFLFRMV
jgi:hypothetical protein